VTTDNVPDDMTREEYRESISKMPQPKVVAATVGAGVGAAVGEIVVYMVEAIAQIDVPNDVEFAVGVVLTAALAFVGGYFKKN
jgi:uncharacterized protein YacL